MEFLRTTYRTFTERYGKGRVFAASALVLALILVVVTHMMGREREDTTAVPTLKSVRTMTVSSLMGTSGMIETLGTIEAVREARLTAEAGGRVTSIPVKLGDAVAPGTIIATIENSTERAAVLQAQGVYEAARAGAATSDVGSASADRAYREALTQATNEYRGAFATADDVLRNTIDQVFAQADTSFPGVRIDSNGRANELSKERVELEKIFDEWAEDTQGELTGNVGDMLSEAQSHVTRLSTLITTLTTLLSEDDAMGTDQEEELLDLRSDFAAARTTINGVLQSLSSARTALISARTAQQQAQIAASNGDVSLAEAQVKQALGALRLAQANLEKTIVRSPIAGTINSLTVKEGTTVTPGTPAAIVSSTGGLEVVAYVNEQDARLITVGTTVVIEDNGSGVVTQLATAIDPNTKKIEMRVGITSGADILTNGESVRLSIQTDTEREDEIRLPVIAIKMTPTGPVIFSVDAERKLVAHPVELGAIIGDTVVIASGIADPDSLTIVTDARGLRAGETVTLQ